MMETRAFGNAYKQVPNGIARLPRIRQLVMRAPGDNVRKAHDVHEWRQHHRGATIYVLQLFGLAVLFPVSAFVAADGRLPIHALALVGCALATTLLVGSTRRRASASRRIQGQECSITGVRPFRFDDGAAERSSSSVAFASFPKPTGTQTSTTRSG
jgi:hypothetical protein